MKINRSIKIMALIWLLFALAFVPVMAAEKFDSADFSRFVEKEMKARNVPGTAVLIVRDGKVIFSRGFGYRDVEKKLKVTPDKVFAIGSSTKAFTALTAGILADEKNRRKKLDRLSPVLPAFLPGENRLIFKRGSRGLTFFSKAGG